MLTKDWATVLAEISGMGSTSDHRVNLSTHVNMSIKPRDGGIGPTRSMWTVSNLELGKEGRQWGSCVMLNFGTLTLFAGVWPPARICIDAGPYVTSGDEALRCSYPQV